MTPNSTLELLETSNIQSKIYTIRCVQVMLDRDLAELYQVETKRINEAVRNNLDKFPSDFYFELANDEFEDLRSKISTTNFSMTRTSPKVFTEQGVYMLATILKSAIATKITLIIIRTFAQMRKLLADNTLFGQQLKELEKRQLTYEIKSDEKFETLFKALQSDIKPSKGIFYDGQIFDAHSFISDLIRSAKSSIMLVDNYIDDTTLTLFAKNQNIKVTLFTHTITKQLQNDLSKYNSQYNQIVLKTLKNSHDRFLIIDDVEIYHIGASLKDLGKKWFGFSKFENDSFGLVERLKNV